MKPFKTWKNAHALKPTQTQQTLTHHQMSTNEAILEATSENSSEGKLTDENCITPGHQQPTFDAKEMSIGEKLV